MPLPTQIKHPLLNLPGSSQLKRLTNALSLSPEFAPIDNNSLPEILYFIYQYSKQVTHYGQHTEPYGATRLELGNWVSFFENSLPFQMVSFCRIDFDKIEKELLNITNIIHENPTVENLTLLLDFFFFELIDPIDKLQKSTRNFSFDFRSYLETTIKSSLLSTLRHFILLSNTSNKYLCVGKRKFVEFSKEPWGIPIEDIFITSSEIEKIPGGKIGAILWLTEQIDEIGMISLGILRQTVKVIPNHLKASLETLEKNHEPHVGLLFTFIRLFGHFQGDLNQLSQAHLDYFYKQVLRIKPKPHHPDKVHLIFEIAQHQKSYLVTGKKVFKDGKDKNNSDILFQLEDEIVIDKAKVNELKTLYLKTESNNKGNQYLEGVYIAPKANSADGKEIDFTDEQSKNWATLGAKSSKFVLPDNELLKNHPHARLGLVLASPVLWLNEGKRTITINITCDADKNELESSDWFKSADEQPFLIQLSGEDGWFTPKNLPNISFTKNEENLIDLIFVVELNGDEPKVAFYIQEKIKDTLLVDCPHPMVKIELNPEFKYAVKNEGNNGPCSLERKNILEPFNVSLYHFLRHLVVTKTRIEVDVKGVKNLVVQNEESLQDVNGLILPFGARPKVTSEFYIGSQEVFCKNWDEFSINVTWKNGPESIEDHYADYGTIKKTGDVGASTGEAISKKSFQINPFILVDGEWIKHSIFVKGECKDSEPELLFGRKNSEDEEIHSSEYRFTKYPSERKVNKIEYLFCKIPKEEKSKICQQPEPTPLGVNTRDGFLKLVLAGMSFQHDRYPFVLARNLMRLAKLIDPREVPNLVDKVQSLEKKLGNYENSEEIIYNDEKSKDIISVKKIVDELLDEIKKNKGEATKVDDVKFRLFTDKGKEINSKIKKILEDELKEIKDILPKDKDLKDLRLPNEPYTPTIKEISIDYIACAEKQDITLIHLYPFENTSKTVKIEEGLTLLPTFDDEGTLFIGLENLRPGSNLQLLFQFAEATAESEIDRAKIQWHFLKDNNWDLLKPGFEIVSDETESLTKSGIIKIALPSQFSKTVDTIMPSIDKDKAPLNWLKVSTAKSVGAVAEVIGIHAQAALSTYSPLPNSDLKRIIKELEPLKITGPLEPDFNIKKVNQPYESFGGKIAESEGHFYTRVSEHLRHKDRGIDIFDYEHLVLENFSQVFKCKCINHSLSLSAFNYKRDFEVAPGFVMVAVMPDLTKLKPGDMMTPKVPVSLLVQINNFLNDRKSPFAKVQVVNPRYEKINVDVKVEFKPGRDKSYYKAKLKTDLKNFLAPWHLGGSDKISIGQTITFSELVGFLENLDYIEFTYFLKLIDTEDDNKSKNEIRPKTARSVLTGGNITVNEPSPKTVDTALLES